MGYRSIHTVGASPLYLLPAIELHIQLAVLKAPYYRIQGGAAFTDTIHIGNAPHQSSNIMCRKDIDLQTIKADHRISLRRPLCIDDLECLQPNQCIRFLLLSLNMPCDEQYE